MDSDTYNPKFRRLETIIIANFGCRMKKKHITHLTAGSGIIAEPQPYYNIGP
jgi:hypothetical protein